MSISQLLANYRMHICTAMSSYGAKKQTAWDSADKCAAAILVAVDQMLADAQTQITDLHAMAESNQTTIDRLLSENAQLRARLAQLKGDDGAMTNEDYLMALDYQWERERGDYAGALESDAELTGDVLAASQGAQ